MERKIDGMISLACSILVVIVFIKCSLAVTVNELEVYPEITLIADEVKQQLDKRCALPKQDDKCSLTGQNVTYLDDKSGECRTHIFNGCKDYGHESVLADPSECNNLNEGCTPCQVHRDSVNARISDGSLPHIGTFVPKCKESSHFKTKQFSGSTGYSFCYDKNGNKVESSDTPPGRGRKLDCSIYVDKDGNPKKPPSKPCQGRPTAGDCKKKVLGYKFDPDSNSCIKFVGGGCGYSNNGFGTKDDCEAKCSTSSIKNQEEAAPASRCQNYGEVCMSDSECCSQNCVDGNCGAI